MIRIQNVLVATDFSETSDAALDYGREIARTFGSTLHVLHVADSVYLMYGGEAYAAGVPDLQEEIEEAARKRLGDLLEHEDGALHVKPVVVAAIGPAAAIVDYAVQHRIDLVVLGTHGRGAFSHLFMGSVAERVVRTAHCPVLTIHHPEHEFIRPEALVATAHA
ncbi:MAG: universal stress protein [Acidobacteriota bacterium]